MPLFCTVCWTSYNSVNIYFLEIQQRHEFCGFTPPMERSERADMFFLFLLFLFSRFTCFVRHSQGDRVGGMVSSLSLPSQHNWAACQEALWFMMQSKRTLFFSSCLIKGHRVVVDASISLTSRTEGLTWIHFSIHSFAAPWIWCKNANFIFFFLIFFSLLCCDRIRSLALLLESCRTINAVCLHIFRCSHQLPEKPAELHPEETIRNWMSP